MPDEIMIEMAQFEHYPAISMIWQRAVQINDVRRAYEKISSMLRESEKSLYIIVDLRDNQSMPLKETITGALFGPYGDPKVLNWLIIGQHHMAKSVAKTLTQITNQKKVIWFDSEIDVIAFLEQKQIQV